MLLFKQSPIQIQDTGSGHSDVNSKDGVISERECTIEGSQAQPMNNPKQTQPHAKNRRKRVLISEILKKNRDKYALKSENKKPEYENREEEADDETKYVDRDIW